MTSANGRAPLAGGGATTARDGLAATLPGWLAAAALAPGVRLGGAAVGNVPGPGAGRGALPDGGVFGAIPGPVLGTVLGTVLGPGFGPVLGPVFGRALSPGFVLVSTSAILVAGVGVVDAGFGGAIAHEDSNPAVA